MPGIITGVILATGRIVGESAALLFTAGSAKALPKAFSALFGKVFQSGGTMTIQLYLSATSEGDFDTAFGIAVVLLVTHATTGLTVATIGVFIAVITLVTSAKYIPELLSKVDYKTLLFFIGLFIVVGGLEQTGILEIVASFIGKISGGNVYLMLAIIIWVSAIASAFVDNIPFAATMIPVIQSLAATTGVSLSTMTWALAMGTDIGGSATPIGASANVVGTSVAAKAGYPVSWGVYCKKAVPATIIVMAICTASIFIRYL